MQRIELDEIQGLVASGYAGYPDALYLLLRVEDAERARAWLRAQLPLVEQSSVAQALARSRARARTNGRSSFARARHGDPTGADLADLRVALAWTAPGLRALGLDERTLATFPPELHGGMAQSFRARALGDLGTDAPKHWRWGSGDREVHALYALFARREREHPWPVLRERLLPEGCGLSAVDEVEATLQTHEPFGFRDGISQPRIDWDRSDGRRASRETSWRNTVALGEFVLGYRNEVGQLAASPWIDGERYPSARFAAVAAERLPERGDGSAHVGAPWASPQPRRRDLGRNGSYLVVRELEQDVEAFLQLSHEDAAKLVGRWRDGTPLTLSPHGEREGLADANDFTYHETDRSGLACPFGAHIRRSNPRDSLVLPERGIFAKEAVEAVNQHRILRRGRTFERRGEGATTTAGAEAGSGTGTFFLCLNADIEQQFEFVQKQWLQSSGFAGLSGERDPLVGAGSSGLEFSVPMLTRTRKIPLRKYVHLRGGAYFFLPSLSALRFLGEALDESV